MPQPIRVVFGLAIAALLVGGPIVYNHYRQAEGRAFRVVREGVLYRSGQMSLAGLKRILREYGIKTVVTLRDAVHPGETPPDWEEEQYCKSEEITYCRITPQRWWASDKSVPAEQGIRRFRKVMDDPGNYPVLVHCFAGFHRTGAYCAVYRMEYEHWSNAQAIAEMRDDGYRNIDNEYDLLDYLETYQPRWQSSPRHSSAQAPSEYRPGFKSVFRPARHKKHTVKKDGVTSR
jgi:protein tyrosine/serine phosphatase